eukprot:GHVN01083301.1.p1 GENE.GHVN01083301.1~~GHVN01083301.1.p1  ORF type:complete len:165 (+),score=14.61 GHVN01083301.1:90-584(+)
MHRPPSGKKIDELNLALTMLFARSVGAAIAATGCVVGYSVTTKKKVSGMFLPCRTIALCEAQCDKKRDVAKPLLDESGSLGRVSFEKGFSEVFDWMRPSMVQVFVAPNNSRPPTFVGSGFIYKRDGHILTAAHVLAQGEQVRLVSIYGSISTLDGWSAVSCSNS